MGILICLLVIGTIIPTISAIQIKPIEPQRFSSCYIVINGELTDKDFPSIIGTSMWKIHFTRPSDDNHANVIYWFIRLNETSAVTIYSEENGEVLWQHQGTTVPQLRMVLFKGIYINDITEDGKLHVEISGNINFAQVIEK